MRKAYIILILLFTCALMTDIRANWGIDQDDENLAQIFRKIEEGFLKGSTEEFSEHFASKVFISLSNGTAGYFSSSQAFYILQDFFKSNRPLSFKLQNLNGKASYPYASGTLRYESRGLKGNSQVYISLKQFGASWKISQITIN